MNKKFLIIIIISFIILGSITGLVIYNLTSEKTPNTPEVALMSEENNTGVTEETNIVNNISTISTNFNEIRVSPNASLTFYKYFNTCGHTTKERITATDNLVNLTKDELANVYSDWQINKFTSSEIELYKEFDASCGEHYLVKSTNGYITIYLLKSDNSTELKETTDIAVKYLSLEDMNELENGVTLYGKDSLNAYIENFE